MKIRKPASLMVADDIQQGAEYEKRSNAVRSYATMLAEKLGASIDLVYVEKFPLYPSHVSRYKALIVQYAKGKRARLNEIVGTFRTPAKAILISGEPANRILSLSSKRAYEMVVLGTHGRVGLKRLILGSVAEEVVRHARIPVMTIGPESHEGAPRFLSGSSLKVLIPTSLTSNSIRAEEYGITLAKRLGAEVVFFHSMHETIHPIFLTAFSVPNPPPQIRGLFMEMKDSLIKQLSTKVKKALRKKVYATYVLNEQTIEASDAVLTESAKIGASLIVMGTHGRSLISGAYFGRTARDVILAATVPVVTVHSKKP